VANSKNGKKKIELMFEIEKETKNTIRFAELEDQDGQPPVVRTLYLQKFATKKLGEPTKIKVVIEPA